MMAKLDLTIKVSDITIKAPDMIAFKANAQGINIEVVPTTYYDFIEIWGKLPNRRHRWELKTSGKVETGVYIDCKWPSIYWLARFGAASMIKPAIDSIRANPNNLLAIMAAVLPFAQYIQQNYHIVRR